MTSPGRVTTALVVVAVSAALPFARTPAAPVPAVPVSSRAVPTVTFSAQGLSFRYPAAWRSGTWNGEVSSFTALIVYLSTSRLRDPCMVATNPVERSVPCAYPLVELSAGGVLVRWADDGFPGFHLPEPNTTIADRPAAETRTSEDGWCPALGGTETITVIIPRDLPDNWYQMDACLRTRGLPPRSPDLRHARHRPHSQRRLAAPRSRNVRLSFRCPASLR